MKIMHVVGARPNFMKVAPVTAALDGQVQKHGQRLAGGEEQRPLANRDLGSSQQAHGQGFHVTLPGSNSRLCHVFGSTGM